MKIQGLAEVVLLCVCSCVCRAADPVVSNVRAQQRQGTKVVDIRYDVRDADGDRLDVTVAVSTNDGASFDLAASSFSGGSPNGYGSGVVAGDNRHVVWDAGVDWNGQVSDRVRFRVTVDDGTSPPAPGGMVLIPGGSNSGTDPDFGAYSLTVSAFYLDRCEVSNDEMVDVMQWAYDRNPRLITVTSSSVRNAEGNQQELLDLDSSYCRITWDGADFGMKAAKGAGYPCVEVTWYGAAAYCNYRSLKEGRTPCYNLADWSRNGSENGYRLPTDEEWEYAARGGVSSKRFPWGGDTIQHTRANYYSSSSYGYDTSSTRGYHPTYNDTMYPYTSPAGSFGAHGYGPGLYDMAGNVWEWCDDWYPGYEGSDRVLRGGCWGSFAVYCRVGARSGYLPDGSYHHVGFRACLPSGQQ